MIWVYLICIISILIVVAIYYCIHDNSSARYSYYKVEFYFDYWAITYKTVTNYDM